MSELGVAVRVVELVRRLAGPDAEAEAGVYHAAEALTRFANSAIHQNVADATTTVHLRLHVGGRTASGATTIADPAGLESLVQRTLAAARLSPPDAGWAGLTPPTPLAGGPMSGNATPGGRISGDATSGWPISGNATPGGRISGDATSGWPISGDATSGGSMSGVEAGVAAAGVAEFDEATERATPAERAARVRDFVRAAGGLETAGYCRTVYASAGFANTAGQAVEGRAVEAGMDGIARSGGADGVARLASGRLADIDGAALGVRAAAKARAGARPIELPPGRYEVVLEPEAVADLLQNLATFGFNGKAYAQRQSFAELGAAQFDAAVTILDDPLAALPFDTEGTPRTAVPLVWAGTTVGVTHDRSSAAEVGARSTGHASPVSRSWGPIAGHPRLAAAARSIPAAPGDRGPTAAGTVPAAPGDRGPTATGSVPAAPGASGPIAASARPLVANVERGLLITDLWYTRVLDQKSLVITGLTRNGVWLIEDGELTAAVGNMRFTQSYPQALCPGAVRGIGTETILLPDRWSGRQFAAPALHLASWNLTGNASG